MAKKPESNQNELIELDNINKDLERRLLLKLLDQGICVYIAGVDDFKDGDNFLSFNIRLLSDVQGHGSFGDIKLKFAKQILRRLKTEINKAVKD